MGKALEVTQAYPEILRPALVEELGWRQGTDLGLQATAWTEVVDSLSEAHACLFGAGMVRGAVLQTLPQGLNWSDSHQVFAQALPEQCHEALDRGLAEALLIALGTDVDGLEAAILDAPQPERVRAVIPDVQSRMSGPTTP